MEKGKIVEMDPYQALGCLRVKKVLSMGLITNVTLKSGQKLKLFTVPPSGRGAQTYRQDGTVMSREEGRALRKEARRYSTSETVRAYLYNLGTPFQKLIATKIHGARGGAIYEPDLLRKLREEHGCLYKEVEAPEE